MSLRFSPARHGSRYGLAYIVPAIAIAALLARLAIVQAQGADQLTVYSQQTTYSVALVQSQGQPYIGLVELLEPLGSVDARPDGKKYKLRFTPPGGRAVELQFNEGKAKGKVLGEGYKLPANFVLQNGRGYVPLSAAPEILTRLLAKPVQLHAAAKRLFISDIGVRYTFQLERGNPPRLTINFPIAVNPSIATEPGRIRFTFRREPVISNGQDKVSFDDAVITGAEFAEHDGVAEIEVMATAPLMASFADAGRTIIVTAVPPPPPAPPPVAPPPTAPPNAQAQPPKPPAVPRFLVLIDPAHGGSDSGAAITPSLVEKDVVLALARRVQRELAGRGIAASMLRNSDATIGLEQRALSANAARPALYISLHAANTGRGVHVFTSLMPATSQPRQDAFLPWDTAQAAFLDLSGSVAGSIAAELEARKLPNNTLVAPLRPMNNIAAPAVAIEIAPPGDNVEDVAGPEYQQQVAQSIAAGIAAARSKLPEVRP
jgi:N-acetylmuramoyl-L-alanine amidase